MLQCSLTTCVIAKLYCTVTVPVAVANISPISCFVRPKVYPPLVLTSAGLRRSECAALQTPCMPCEHRPLFSLLNLDQDKDSAIAIRFNSPPSINQSHLSSLACPYPDRLLFPTTIPQMNFRVHWHVHVQRYFLLSNIIHVRMGKSQHQTYLVSSRTRNICT